MTTKELTIVLLRRIIKLLLWTVGSLIALFIIISALLQIPNVQKYAVNRTTEIVSSKTNMVTKVKSVHISFTGAVKIGGVYVEDQMQDTLLYCHEISIGMELFPLIRKQVSVGSLEVEGLKGRIVRDAKDSLYNFYPMLEAFVSDKEEKTKTKSSWSIGFDEIQFENIDLSLHDGIDSSSIRFFLGHLNIKDYASDLTSGQLDLESIDIGQVDLKLRLSDRYKQPEPGNVSSKKNQESPLSIKLRQLDANDISFELGFTSEKLFLSVALTRAQLIPGTIDLSAHRISLEQLIANTIDVELNIDAIDSMATQKAYDDSVFPALEQHAFGDSDWDFSLDHAELLNSSCTMNFNEKERYETGMDYSHMGFFEFNMVADWIFFNNDSTGASVSLLNFKEVSGAQLDSLTGDFFIDNTKIVADNLFFQSPKSYLLGSVALGYSGLQNIGNDLGKLEIRSDLKGLISISEIQPFYPLITEFPILKNVQNIKISDFRTKGNMENLTLIKSDFSVGKSSFVSVSANITGLQGSDVHLDFSIDTLHTIANDISQIIPDSMLPDYFELPEFVGINSKGKFSAKAGEISSSINSNLGQIEVEGSFEENDFLSTVSLDELDLATLLKDSIFGTIKIKSQISGKYNETGVESVNINAELNSVQFNGYSYQNGVSQVKWSPNILEISTRLSDSSLTADLNGIIRFQDSASKYDISLAFENADLHDLNVTEEDFSTSGLYRLNMEVSNANNYRGWINAEDIELKNQQNSFRINSLLFNVDINDNYTNFILESEIANASLTGNTKMSELKDAIIDQIDLYVELPDSIVNNKNFEFEFNLDLKNPDIFTEFVVPGLDEIILERCYAKYNDSLNVLLADVRIPKIEYNGIIYDDLFFNMDSNTDSANSSLSLKSVRYDSIIINNLSINSTLTHGQAKNRFTIHDLNDSLKYQFLTYLNYADSIYTVSIAPDQTVIDYDYWTLPEDNYLRYEGNNFFAKSTKFKNGSQEFGLYIKDKDLVFNFDRFQLQNITNFIEDDSISNLMAGEINGMIVIHDPLKNSIIRSDLEIPELSLLNEKIGKFHAKIEYENNIGFDIRLFDDENELAANGIFPIEEDKNANFIFESKITNAASFQPFFESYLEELSGQFQGRLSLVDRNGQTSVNGNFTIDDLNFTVLTTNTVFKNKGQISIRDNVFRIENFEVRDSLNNQFNLGGTVDLGVISNPKYDLKLSTDNFLVVNSRQTANWPIFGKLFMGLTTEFQGYQSALSVKSEISINEKTDVTYVMPGQELELISDEGIVEFIEFEKFAYEKSKTTNQFIGDSLVATVAGIDLIAKLNVDPRAKFTVIVDPNSGDFSTFRVSTTMQYKYNDTQRGILNGVVEFEDGFYELSFYGLVKKRFNFDPGSMISWSGEVMDGSINFAARHTVRTNSVSLVSNEISNYERPLYNQRLPYDVILKVGDKINYPSISFELDLPQRFRNAYPTLDSKLNILNQPSSEAERNKQVFALLVGGTFIPENPEIAEGSSSDNFATTAARNSVNAIMTQQLNKLTGQFIQGFDVDMGVNTFDDYSRGNIQTRTQLDVKVSKNLFNDRVSAEMESHIDLEGSNQQVAGQSNAGMTEFAVSYKLTKTGNYRIKAFRENAFDIFDGEIQNAGIAFIFVREFDSFKKIRPDKLQDTIQIKDTDTPK